jgi:ABC-2 type transport system permease protein
MIFLRGLFLPIVSLPVFLRPLSYILPVAFGVNILHGAVNDGHTMSLPLDFIVLGAFCIVLFAVSLRNIRHRWIS